MPEAYPGLNDDFCDLLDALTGEEVDFIVVGAHAMAVHGVPRATGDLDVLVRPSPENAARVMSALRRFGAPMEAHGVSQSDFEVQGTVYQLGLPPRRIDILTAISGVSFQHAWESRVTATVDGRSLPILGRMALQQNKRAAGRPKDLVDLAILEKQEL